MGANVSLSILVGFIVSLSIVNFVSKTDLFRRLIWSDDWKGKNTLITLLCVVIMMIGAAAGLALWFYLD
jgi:hypothetical protein